MILLGLDLGAKRTGVAVAKEGHIFTRDTIVGWDSYDQLSKQISDIIRDDKIDKVIAGVPESASGDAAHNVITVIGKLEKDIGASIEQVDETLTSMEAGRRLQNIKESNHGNKDDNREAAKIILEDYLAR